MSGLLIKIIARLGLTAGIIGFWILMLSGILRIMKCAEKKWGEEKVQLILFVWGFISLFIVVMML